MPEIRHIFIDDGDVMNDNRLRALQWQRLVGEFFVPRLGGTAEAWAAANVQIFPGVLDRFERRLQAGERYRDVQRDYESDWMTAMCRCVGVTAPPGEACFELSRKASIYITRRVRSSYPGATEALRALGERFELFTASNEVSYELEGYLEGMGVADLFHGFYGPDLIDATKHHDTYYQRLFAHSGVDPAMSLVVDDKIEFLRQAMAQGARVVRVGAGAATDNVPVIASLAKLPALIDGGLVS